MELEEYVATRGPALLRLAHVLCGDPDRAQDLVQTALVDAFRHWRRVTRADHPDAYVRRILVNAHLAHLASVRRRSSGEIPVGDVPDAAARDEAGGLEDRDGFRAVLDGLPPRARTVLVLRYWSDLSDDAIADALGVSPVTVRATASRALATLRERAAAGPDDGPHGRGDVSPGIGADVGADVSAGGAVDGPEGRRARGIRTTGGAGRG